MAELKGLIEEYITKKVKGADEKEHVRQLLLVELKPYLEEEQLPFDISLESLQVREAYRQKIADAFVDLLSKTSNSKEYTQKRIVSFAEYLKKIYNVDLNLDEVFKREAVNPYERLVDLLKTLQEGKTKQELLDYYSISRKPLEKDINELVMGTNILGQKVKIRDTQRDQNRITYQSSIHPIFLPLNMTEVYYLIMGLKSLSTDNEAMTNKTFDHLANRIYCQLSDYGRNKIDKKGKAMGIKFPHEDEFEKYNGSIDEEKMSTLNRKNTLAYLWKAGNKCTVHMNNNEMEVIVDCYIDYNISTSEVFVKDSIDGQRKRKININQILDIQYEYK